jgi:acyl-CoA hydrolase
MIQLGVGALPEAILSRLAGHRDLGVHAGMVSDGVLSLIEAGAITNAHKSVCRGFSVTGAALGSVRLFDALAGRENIVFKPAAFTHAPATLAGVGPLAAINSAVEIDLTGQVNAESAGGRRIGAVGGQVDFLRAAAQGGGKPILARSLTGLADAARTKALLELAGDQRAEELAPTAAQRLTA